MKRNFILVCVSALVLALGLSATVSAEVSATAAAKGAKKGKSCKGKAGKSSAASAQAKKKGKKKACKAKGKGKGTQPGATPLSDGTYGDAANKVELNVSNGGTSAILKYTPPGGCVAINYTSEPVTLTKNGDTWTANETRAFSLVGEPANAKWDLTVKESGLTYALNFTLESNTMIGPCKWEGHPSGTLAKVG